EKQPGFCRVMLGSSFQAEGLSAESADTAIANIEDALATDPPAEIADALRELEPAFERVADGDDPGDVGAPFATLTRYTVDRCGPFRVTTTLATQGATPRPPPPPSGVRGR